MKDPYGEGLATHTGPESCGVLRKERAEALTGVRAGRVLSRERVDLREADAVGRGRRQNRAHSRVGRAYPKSVIGVHLNMLAVGSQQGRKALKDDGRE